MSPDYELKYAEAAMSPDAAERQRTELFDVAPRNPFQIGHEHEVWHRRRIGIEIAKRLIWC